MTARATQKGTAIAGYVDARGVVGFLLEARRGRCWSLKLGEPVDEVRELTIEELKAGELAGHVRAS